MLRLHYVPGGHGSSVCSKRSVPLDVGHCVYISVFLRCSTISITGRDGHKPVCHGGAKVLYGYPRSITIISTFFLRNRSALAVNC